MEFAESAIAGHTGYLESGYGRPMRFNASNQCVRKVSLNSHAIDRLGPHPGRSDRATKRTTKAGGQTKVWSLVKRVAVTS